MIQILIKPSEKYSLAEMVQMAVEGGAAWVVLDARGISDDELRLSSTEIVALCRESSTMLTIVDRPDAARELGLHGVFLTLGSQSPAVVREELGPEAVVGAEVGAAATAVSLAAADIDYVALSHDNADAAKIISDARLAGCEIPFVAMLPEGGLSSEHMSALIDAGFNGFCVGGDIFEANDPVEAITKLIGE